MWDIVVHKLGRIPVFMVLLGEQVINMITSLENNFRKC